MVRIKIYAEGGGDDDLLHKLFREGWRRFFKSAGLDEMKKMPSVVAGGSRMATFKQFRNAVAKPQLGVIPLLLVDSEGPVAPGQSAWQHLEDPGAAIAGPSPLEAPTIRRSSWFN